MSVVEGEEYDRFHDAESRDAANLICQLSTPRAARSPFPCRRFAVGCLFGGLPHCRREDPGAPLGDRALRRHRNQAGGGGVSPSPPVSFVERRRPQSRWISLPRGRAWTPDAEPGLSGRHPAVERVRLRAPVKSRYIELTATAGSCHLPLARRPEQRSVAPKFGRAPSRAGGRLRYGLPARTDCRACHEGNISRVLGFWRCSCRGRATRERRMPSRCARAMSISRCSSVRAG